jgi:amidohydrolase
MDALPLEDKKAIDYASTRAGVAHACGHDAHTAMLLGAARLITDHADALAGNVKFIFQPSEDRAPGGALPMIEEGVLKDPEVQGLFTVHLNSGFPEGTVTVKSGPCTISSASFLLKMVGKGGHVSSPHRAVDPILMAALCIVSAQTIISRRTDPLEPATLAFTAMQGGTASNVIPKEAVLTGTIRTPRPEDREILAAKLEDVAGGVARIFGGRHELAVTMEYPAVYNDGDMVARLRRSAVKIVDPAKILTQAGPIMAGEDVSYFHQQVPAVLWFLGTHNPEKGFIHPHHSPLFDFNEAVMPLGAAIHARSVLDFLKQSKP